MSSHDNTNTVGNPLLWFVCKYCGRAFQLGDALIEHKKRQHKKELRAERKRSRAERRLKKSLAEEEKVGDENLKEKPGENKPENSEAPAVGNKNIILVKPTAEVNKSDKVIPPAGADGIVAAIQAAPVKTVAEGKADESPKKSVILEPVPEKISPITGEKARVIPPAAGKLPETILPATNVSIGKSAAVPVEKVDEMPPRALRVRSTSASKEVPPPAGVSTIRKVCKSFRCSFCRRLFKNAGACAMHTKTHTGDTPYKCQVCPQAFRIKSDWKAHELTHGEHTCRICSQIFFSLQDLSAHESTHVGPAGGGTVNKSSRIKRNRKKRKFLYSFPKQHKCYICGVRFATIQSLELHKGREHPVQESQYICRFCKKTFATSNSCRIHEFHHTGETPYECLYCDLGFATSGRRISHMKKVHPREYAASSRCYKDSDEEQEQDEQPEAPGVPVLQSPATASKEVAKEPIKVTLRLETGRDQVQKAYILPQKQSMIPKPEAIEERDPAVFKHPCSSCGKRFKRRDGLREHEKRHLGLKPFSCGVCGKTFSEKRYLRAHGRIHTGEKPFKCGTCPKTFVTRQDRERHVTVHTGAKPYKCSVCKAGFRYQQSLKTHLARHEDTESPEGETVHRGPPIQCRLCPTTFRYRRSFNRHMARHRAAGKGNPGQAPHNKVRTVSIVHPTTRGNVGEVDSALAEDEKGETKSGAEDKSSRPKSSNDGDPDPTGIIRQECSSGLIHYTCTLCGKVYWYRNEINAHVQLAHLGPSEA